MAKHIENIPEHFQSERKRHIFIESSWLEEEVMA